LEPAKERAPKASQGISPDARAVANCRKYRRSYNGKKLKLRRGEFHRHSEISGDGGRDGGLDEMWRYGIDVASLDWMGSGDHMNGRHREYPWWLTQKTGDAYQIPGRFDPMFSYERSVGFPDGHRNVLFAQRGIRSLPTLPVETESEQSAPDTQMLYSYLRKFGGVCAAHTSATGAWGTDWRANDPSVEPFVEIYQGARQSYERAGAPRAPAQGEPIGAWDPKRQVWQRTLPNRTPMKDDAIGYWNPKGFVDVALKKGYRLAFEASSDHLSTRMSYTMVLAEASDRNSILNAIRARHVYAATDNIIADFGTRVDGVDYMMGDVFSVSEPPVLRIRLRGTAPFERVVLVKDGVETVLAEPGKQDVDLSWTDPSPVRDKTAYYYVRAEQRSMNGEPGELVWISPMWITYRPAD
jgi:hypothetical protein